MAIESGTLTTYQSTGNREDLADMIWNTDPTDTPGISQVLGRTEATAVTHEWQTDTYAAAASNAAIEGDQASFSTPATTSRLSNVCQIFTKTLVVSRTQDVVRKAGRRSESDYQLGKRIVELKRDMEFVVMGNQAVNTGGTGTARAMRSLEAWYATNDQRGTNGADGTTTQAATDATTAGIRAFNEVLLKAAIKAAWDAGGNPSVLVLGSWNKQTLSGFTGNATRMLDAPGKRLIASIDVYESDFGALRAMPNRFSRSRTVHVLDPELVALAELDGFKLEPLAKVGDSRRWLATTEVTLEVRNEKGLAVIADLTTS